MLSKEHLKRFRLLSEFYSFLCTRKSIYITDEFKKFPSPFGVLFFFIRIWIFFKFMSCPVSVSFRSSILFYDNINSHIRQVREKVSVSFRSSILFYPSSDILYVSNCEFPSPFGVLFFFIRWYLKWMK